MKRIDILIYAIIEAANGEPETLIGIIDTLAETNSPNRIVNLAVHLGVPKEVAAITISQHLMN